MGQWPLLHCWRDSNTYENGMIWHGNVYDRSDTIGALSDIRCWQVDELQTQLQKKLLGSSPSPSTARSRASAAPAASNAVTYSSSARGAGAGGSGGGFSHSDDALGDEQGSGAVPSSDQHVNSSSSASYNSYGIYDRPDDGATPSDGNGSADMSNGRHEHGGNPADSLTGRDSTVHDYSGRAAAEPASWRDGIELEPASDGSYVGYQQRSPVQPRARAAAAGAVLTGCPSRAGPVQWRGFEQRAIVVHGGGLSRCRVGRSCGPLRVAPRIAPLHPVSGCRAIL